MFKVCWILIQSLTILGLLCTRLSATPLQEIQKRGTFRIGVKENLPLLGYRDRQGTLAGFEIELAQRMSQTIWGDRIQVEYVPLLNQDRLSAVTSGKVDLAIANLHITESRRRVVFFSQPYLQSETRFVTTFPTEARLSQIETGTIGVLQGSIAIGRLRARFPNASLVGVRSYQDAQRQLRSEQIDSFAADMMILRGWQFGQSVTTHPEQQSKDQPPISLPWQVSLQGIGRSHIAIAMPKGLPHKHLHDAVNLALETLEQSGELQQMRNKWRLSLDDRTALDRLDALSKQLGTSSINIAHASYVY